MDPTHLSISLEGFLKELGLAWQRLSLYQEDHPARHEVALRAHTALAALTAARGGLAVGVAQDGFVGRDRKVAGGPAGRLAESLYRRHVAVVRFAEETTVDDLRTFLQTVPRGRPAEGEAPLWEDLAGQGVDRVSLEPVDLTYVDADGEATAPDRRSEPLWDSLLRSVLDQLEPGEGGGGPARSGPAGAGGSAGRPPGSRSLGGVLEAVTRVLARRGIALEELRGRTATGPGRGAGRTSTPGAPGPGGAPADPVATLGAALGATVASRLADGGSGHDVAELLRALPDALSDVVLDRAVAELAAASAAPEGAAASPAPARAGGLETLAECLPTLQVIGALRRVRAAGVAFSPSVTALIEGLVTHAGRAAPAKMSAPELAGELAALFGDDDPDRVLPREEELDRLALDLACLPPPVEPDPGAVALRVESLAEHRRLTQLAMTLLDLLARPFLKRSAQEAVVRRLGEVFRSFLAEGALARAMRIPERLQALRAAEETAAAAELALEELRKPASAAAFLERPDDLPASAASAALRLSELLGDPLLDGLLEAMCEEEDLSRRRKVFDLMVSLGPPVVPRAQALLEDERWYVQRNMISLLRRIGGLSAEALRRGLDQRDPRVRLEALKGLGRGPASAELIERAVSDPDPKVAQTAIAAIGTHRLGAGVAPLVALLAPRDPFGRHRALRLLALETLGQIGDPSALAGISHFLRPWFSPVGAEERRAAYASLAGYPPESRRPWLEKGRWSLDAAIRRTCREMLRAAGEAS